jgi:hypothetical protein
MRTVIGGASSSIIFTSLVLMFSTNVLRNFATDGGWHPFGPSQRDEGETSYVIVPLAKWARARGAFEGHVFGLGFVLFR